MGNATYHFKEPIPMREWQTYDTQGKVRMVADGLGWMPNTADGENWTTGYRNTYGSMLGGKRYTCMYQSDEGNSVQDKTWALQLGAYTDGTRTTVGGRTINGKIVKRGVGSGVSMDAGEVKLTHPYTMFDLSDPKHADLNARAGPWKGRKVCMPTMRIADSNGKQVLQGVPEYDVQPIASERAKWCGEYDKQMNKTEGNPWKVAHVVYGQSQSGYVYQCATAPNSQREPQGGIPWPK